MEFYLVKNYLKKPTTKSVAPRALNKYIKINEGGHLLDKKFAFLKDKGASPWDAKRKQGKSKSNSGIILVREDDQQKHTVLNIFESNFDVIKNNGLDFFFSGKVDDEASNAVYKLTEEGITSLFEIEDNENVRLLNGAEDVFVTYKREDDKTNDFTISGLFWNKTKDDSSLGYVNILPALRQRLDATAPVNKFSLHDSVALLVSFDDPTLNRVLMLSKNGHSPRFLTNDKTGFSRKDEKLFFEGEEALADPDDKNTIITDSKIVTFKAAPKINQAILDLKPFTETKLSEYTPIEKEKKVKKAPKEIAKKIKPEKTRKDASQASEKNIPENRDFTFGDLLNLVGGDSTDLTPLLESLPNMIKTLESLEKLPSEVANTMKKTLLQTPLNNLLNQINQK
ncbi:MAG: hypothetical protein JW812_00165 [Alphaproteobacteria bacterium]|nr:hypothetical protein [Alphaproteobacteria bacterium]MBN2779645.1 hypothetical protein [Alphaproteobacteria bacterium]